MSSLWLTEVVVDSNILQWSKKGYLFKHRYEGSLIGKIEEVTFNLLEEMTANNYQWLVERLGERRPQGINEIDAFSSINSK